MSDEAREQDHRAEGAAVLPDVEEERRAARPVRTLGPWWLGVAGVGVAALLLVTENLRWYGWALGGTLAVLALLRAVLPESRAGGLVVRSRWLDVTTLLAFGSAVAVLASTLRLEE